MNYCAAWFSHITRDSQTRFDGNDDYTQAGDLYRLMSADQKTQLIGNQVGALKTAPSFIQARQIGHFYKADPDYGSRVSQGLGLKIEEVISKVT